MRTFACSSAATLLFTAGHAFGFTVSLKAGPTNALTTEGASATYAIPLAGATFDISVSFDRSPSEPQLQGMQMSFVSDGSGAAMLNSARCNTPTWTGSPPISPGPLNTTPRGQFACSGDFNTTHALMGWINVTVSSAASPRSFTITPQGVVGLDADFNDVAGQGTAITIIQPEPASALLLLGALPFFRRRRLALSGAKGMRAFAWYSATALFITAGSALGFSATLKGNAAGGPLGTAEGTASTITFNDLAAHTLDLSVTLDAAAPTHAPGVQMDFVSNGGGAATLNGSIGGITTTGTGTRFNGPGEWDADGSCSIPAAGALNATARGPYACGYSSGDWSTLHTLMGWINVTVSATTTSRTFTITPANILDAGIGFPEDPPNQGVAFTINQLPEPGGARLLFGALPFLRRRKKR